MEIKELKNKIKIVFPAESEIFMAEEFLASVHDFDLAKKDMELDLTEVNSLDTVFLQIALSLIKTAKQSGKTITLKTSEAFESACKAYGLRTDELTGGN